MLSKNYSLHQRIILLLSRDFLLRLVLFTILGYLFFGVYEHFDHTESIVLYHFAGYQAYFSMAENVLDLALVPFGCLFSGVSGELET